MYNLFVSANKDDWEGGYFKIAKFRFGEHTKNAIKTKYEVLTTENIVELKKLPCIFAYEEHCNKDPKFGYVTSIEERHRDTLKIEYQIKNLSNFLRKFDLSRMGFELDISDTELNRTHWAIKDVDLVKELQKVNISIPAQENHISSNTENTSTSDQNSENSVTRKKWYINFKILLSVILGALSLFGGYIYININNSEGGVIQKNENSQIHTGKGDIIGGNKIVNQTKDALIGLDSLESGKSLDEIATGTYFFVDAIDLAGDYDDLSRLEAQKFRKRSDDFEVQKTKKGLLIIGYINSENYSKRGSITENNIISLTIMPQKWAEYKKLVGIPFSSIVQIDSRIIETSATSSLLVLDLESEAVTSDVRYYGR